jgi:hypothetical protein
LSFFAPSCRLRVLRVEPSPFSSVCLQ